VIARYRGTGAEAVGTAKTRGAVAAVQQESHSTDAVKGFESPAPTTSPSGHDRPDRLVTPPQVSGNGGTSTAERRMKACDCGYNPAKDRGHGVFCASKERA